MTYVGLESATNQAMPHLGGNVKVGDPFTYCPSVWDHLINRFCVSSALDIGSGSGNASEYLFRRRVRVVALDGFQENINISLYPAILHDLTKGAFTTCVDLVHCQEVVEHIEEKFLDNILESLCCGKICVMTHAVPGQSGYHHVNLQPPEYWIGHMERRGCILLHEDTARVRSLAERDGAKYMRDTGLVFANRSRY